MERVIIDVDCALGVFGRDVDDGLALALALHSPELEVAGVTMTFGNTSLARVERSVRRLLEKMGRGDVPVHAGAASKHDYGRQTGASEFIAEQLAAAPGQTTLVCLGPLTNAGTAEMLHPGTLAAARRCVCMGGVLRGPGMMPPFFAAEFNIWCDPHAAKQFVNHAANLTLVPLDLTKTVVFGPEQLEQLKQSDSPLGRWLFENIASWHAISTPFSLLLARRAGFMPHDPLAMGFLLWPELYETAADKIQIITRGAHRGRTERAKDGREVTYTSDVNEKEFLDRLVRRLQYNG